MRTDPTPSRRVAGAIAAAIALLALAAATSAAAQDGGAVFVSPSGSDANSGMSPDQPFQTLEHARDVMRATPIKTVFLEGGLYPRTAPLALTAADAGETWSALRGQTPVLDGGGTVKRGVSVTGSHIALRWLTLQNYAETGIFGFNAADVLVDSNTVKNIRSTAWNQGGIVFIGGLPNGRITHNLVQNSQYDGILVATSEKDSVNNLLIQDNAVHDVCTLVADCGGIHVNDRGHASTNIRINHNVIGRYGSDHTAAKAIYMDDLLSNAEVTNNIIYGNGQYGIQVHGGDHNLIQNNIFDVREATAAVLYQVRTPGLLMEGNVFRCNIILSRSSRPLWRNLGGGVAATEDHDRYLTGSDALADFVDPGSRNYLLRAAESASYCGFKPISTEGVGPRPNSERRDRD